MSVTDPDNRIGIMIYNRGNVLVTLGVAGFIDTDSLKNVKSEILVRFQVIHDTCNTTAYSSPGNTHIFGNGRLVQRSCKPCNSQIKILGKSAVRESPGNRSSHNTMNRAGHSVCSRLYFHKNTTTVQSSPCLFAGTGIIPWKLFPVVTVRTTILVVLMWLCFNNDLPDTAVGLFKGNTRSFDSIDTLDIAVNRV